MHRLQSHQRLLAQRVLLEVVGDMWEQTIFVSHEWLGWDHADPDNEQFSFLKRVLQQLQEAERALSRAIDVAEARLVPGGSPHFRVPCAV